MFPLKTKRKRKKKRKKKKRRKRAIRRRRTRTSLARRSCLQVTRVSHRGKFSDGMLTVAVSPGEKTIKWIKGALIGAGSFGKVYLGMDAATGLLMAVKQVELPTGSAPNEERKKAMLSALEREIELLRDLHHENIVQYHCE